MPMETADVNHQENNNEQQIPAAGQYNDFLEWNKKEHASVSHFV